MRGWKIVPRPDTLGSSVTRPSIYYSVLVIEDDAATREAIALALVEARCVVTVVSEGRAALGYLRAGHRVDVILLDLVMAGMDGWAFLEARQRDPDLAAIPVVVVSGHSGRMHHARAAGVAAVLAKPVDPDVMARAIARYARCALS